MTLDQAIQLEPHVSIIVDESGDKHLFLGLDEDNDLRVSCQGAPTGVCYLYRNHCHLPKETT